MGLIAKELSKLESLLDKIGNVSSEVAETLENIIDVAANSRNLMNCSIISQKRQLLSLLLNAIINGMILCFLFEKNSINCFFRRTCKLGSGSWTCAPVALCASRMRGIHTHNLDKKHNKKRPFERFLFMVWVICNYRL